MPITLPATIQSFITKWVLSGTAERATTPSDVASIAGSFNGKPTKKRLDEIARLLETLEALGRAKVVDAGWV